MRHDIPKPSARNHARDAGLMNNDQKYGGDNQDTLYSISEADIMGNKHCGRNSHNQSNNLNSTQNLMIYNT